MKSNFFEIVVVGYNCEKWVEKCLNSIISQTYKNFHLTIVDDSSIDNTKNIIENILKNNEVDYSFYIREKNIGSGLENIIYAIDQVKNEDSIIITIDLDDWLANDRVFEYINQVYQNEDIWMTYGNMESSTKQWSGILKEINDTTTYRKTYKSWDLSHLRTFKYKLFNKINREDLKKDGKYPKVAWDVAFMLPLIEMSGKEHSKYIKDILYIYNTENPFSDFRTQPKQQIDIANYFRNKDSYKQTEKL